MNNFIHVPMHKLYAILSTALFFSSTQLKSEPTKAEPMNVVFILADDLGWADTSLFGKTELYETPNLERLAKRGMLFSRSYASPLCSPTRAAILTGQTNLRNGSTTPAHHLGVERLKPVLRKNAPLHEKAIIPESVTRLDTAYPTLVTRFKKAGYATAHFGKWHLGPEPYSPLEHGFDVDIPHFNGPGPGGGFIAPWSYKNLKPNKPGEHIEDRMAEEAVKWMKSVKNKPFFLNYWMFSVHAPFDAKEGLIKKYRGKIDPKDPQHSPTYAAMVESTDDAVGTLMDAIDELGLTSKTVFIFTSDNGGNMYNGIKETDKNAKPFIVEPTSNRPLRGGKATIYEGGIRVPTVIAWPSLTKKASHSEEIIQCIDFYPTLVKGLGVSMPKGHIVDGIDITPALKGGKLDRAGIITYFPHSPPIPDWLPPSISVHSGDWKLIRLFHQGEKGAHAYRLYNLREDIGESKDLTKQNPEKVKSLDKIIQDHIDDTKGIVPVPNPRFDPAEYKPESIGIQPKGLKVAGNPKPKAKRKPKKKEQKKP
ncbi:MAG: arylsulfatase A-like enzyme [Cryomorphaceae bacterium]|jgi:arylsulfatase A-like enzyme